VLERLWNESNNMNEQIKTQLRIYLTPEALAVAVKKQKLTGYSMSQSIEQLIIEADNAYKTKQYQ
jgi:hypothetical protein